MKNIFAVCAMICAGAAFASPSWLAVEFAPYTLDASPSDAGSDYYSAYYCTVAAADTMFGGRTTAAMLTPYLANDYLKSEAALIANDTAQRATVSDYVQTFDYDTFAKEYNIVNSFVKSDALDPASAYLAVLLYRNGADTAIAVYDQMSWQGGNLVFAGTPGVGTGWAAAIIPEPSSGLLLLVGMGVLALRRKRA